MSISQVQLLLTLPLLKIHQLNKLLNIVLFHMFILQSLLALPLILLKIHQLNMLFSIILLTYSFFKVSFSHYPSSTKSTNCTLSSVSFSIMYFFSNVSSLYYPSSSKSSNGSEEEGCDCG
jgi:hypothetical protein